jgi:hypothetical protein
MKGEKLAWFSLREESSRLRNSNCKRQTGCENVMPLWLYSLVRISLKKDSQRYGR